PTDDRILRLRRTTETPDNYLKEDLLETESKEHHGKQLYTSFCASCHKEDGLGVKGTFPPLKNAARVKDNDAFIDLLLNGSKGKGTIDGVFYEQGMASFSFLKDDELAAIINYVKKELGEGKQVSDDNVKKKRK